MANVEINDKMVKVLEKGTEVALWDEIYMHDGFDKYEEHYCIFETWKDVERFEAFVKEVLELDESDNVESELETNIVFFDEYSYCEDCGNIIRTSPDSYSWQPDYYFGDGFLVCGDCFRSETDYQEAYLEEKINNPKNAINGLIEEAQLEELGFEKLNDSSYESGWYSGQNAKPEAIYDKIKDEYEEIVFFIDSVGQFDIHFSVWVR